MLSKEFNFLVVGAGRGGTSLIAGLLDSHSKLEVGLELFSVDCLVGKNIFTSGANIFNQRVNAFVVACRKKAMLYPSHFWGNKITTGAASCP